MDFGGILPAAGGALGAYLGGPTGAIAGAGIGAQISGAQQANAQNKEIAEKQMDFQERMSSTAYQRAITDMRLAGINPMLAVGSGGASTPSGASATMSNPFEGLAASAMELAAQKSNLAKTEADTNVSNSQTVKNTADAAKSAQEADLAAAQIIKTKADTDKSRVETDVARKGIPNAEVTNDIYSIIRPWTKKLKDGFGDTPKNRALQEQSRKNIQRLRAHPPVPVTKEKP